jgi:hypothetical protein
MLSSSRCFRPTSTTCGANEYAKLRFLMLFVTSLSKSNNFLTQDIITLGNYAFVPRSRVVSPHHLNPHTRPGKQIDGP